MATIRYYNSCSIDPPDLKDTERSGLTFTDLDTHNVAALALWLRLAHLRMCDMELLAADAGFPLYAARLTANLGAALIQISGTNEVANVSE